MPNDGVTTRMIGLGGINVPDQRLRKLRPEVVEQLAASIRSEGLIQPVRLRTRPRGGLGYVLVAGRHRLEAVRLNHKRKLGPDSIRAEISDDANVVKAETAEIIENLIRAELSPAERAAHQARLKELYEGQYPETKKGATGRRGRGNKLQVATYIKDVAKKTGRHHVTVSRETSRGAKIPDVATLAGTSLDKGDELDAFAKLPPVEQRKLAKRAQTGEKVSAKTRLKQLTRDAREQGLAREIYALPKRKYGVILADPEWQFEPWSRETGMDRAAANHYPTSCTGVIAARDVPSIAAKDCFLFLCATAPMLPHALLVMAAWGFNYVTNVELHKNRFITGYWFRNRHEHLLLGIRGNVPCPAPGTQWESVIEMTVGRHSEKPDAVYQMIEAYFPNLPKIELNCRGKPRSGWDGWGNEVQLEAAE